MPGNVVRDKQNYAKEILTGASGLELQFVDRMSTNLLKRYLQISKRENRHCGSQYFSVLYKTDNKISWKNKLSTKLKIGCLHFHVQLFFLWCINESY